MTGITPARPELIALAAATRGLEWAAHLDGALAAAAANGWPWERSARYACRLMFDPAGEPRDLREAARDPSQQRPVPSPPSAEYAAARAAMAGAA